MAEQNVFMIKNQLQIIPKEPVIIPITDHDDDTTENKWRYII